MALIKADKIEEALSATQSAQKVSFDFSFYKVGYFPHSLFYVFFVFLSDLSFNFIRLLNIIEQ